ncbi:MAG: aminoacyl--tRNA ligase-related protein [Candidatus Saccharimonas sp.]
MAPEEDASPSPPSAPSRTAAIRTSEGYILGGLGGPELAGEADVIVVPAWFSDGRPAEEELRSLLKTAHARGACVVGLCLGAIPLAEAGLIGGRRAVTHWRAFEPMAREHPEIALDESVLYVDHGDVLTSAGAAGKFSRGLFRGHQFNKLEMYIFCTPEQSVQMHEKILSIEEEIWQNLGVPYHVVNIAAGDLGAPAAKKYDIEYWSPVDNQYRELTSCSNCTDFQARNLNIRVRRSDGSLQVLHTLNGTAVSLARSLVAIIENYQTDDGKLRVPEVLRPYLGNREEL